MHEFVDGWKEGRVRDKWTWTWNSKFFCLLALQISEMTCPCLKYTLRIHLLSNATRIKIWSTMRTSFAKFFVLSASDMMAQICHNKIGERWRPPLTMTGQSQSPDLSGRGWELHPQEALMDAALTSCHRVHSLLSHFAPSGQNYLTACINTEWAVSIHPS